MLLRVSLAYLLGALLSTVLLLPLGGLGLIALAGFVVMSPLLLVALAAAWRFHERIARHPFAWSAAAGFVAVAAWAAYDPPLDRAGRERLGLAAFSAAMCVGAFGLINTLFWLPRPGERPQHG